MAMHRWQSSAGRPEVSDLKKAKGGKPGGKHRALKGQLAAKTRVFLVQGANPLCDMAYEMVEAMAGWMVVMTVLAQCLAVTHGLRWPAQSWGILAPPGTAATKPADPRGPIVS